MIKRLLLATSNHGKVDEFRSLFSNEKIGVDDLRSHPNIIPPAETGRTFRANAMLKASYYSEKTGAWTLADDSGLEVDALAGRPGVHSARWAELSDAGKGDAANVALLLSHLTNVPDAQRSARFVCVLAVSDPDGTIAFTVEGHMRGSIVHVPHGTGGFGYDPVFLVPGLGRTAAQLTPTEKHAVSHRGNAMRRLVTLMDHLKPMSNL